MIPPREDPPETILQLHEGLESQGLSVVTVVEGYLRRMSEGRHLGAYLEEFHDRALDEAKTLDDLRERRAWTDLLAEKPLFGLPIAIKDNLHVLGERTTCGSRLLEHYRAPFEATVVSRLRAAGAVLLGKTNMDEFAMGGSGENSAFGPSRHPLFPDRVPGGSSSGSASAVAGRMALAALGSDTGGSIRLPASFCGIVGLKPTYGRVSRHGLVAFGSSLDQVGPMGHCVDDVAAIYKVIQGHDPRDATSALAPMSPPGREGGKGALRVGIPAEFFVEGIDAEVRSAIDGALERLRAAGAELVPISLPHSVHAISVYYIIAMAEASSNLARFDGVRFGVRPAEASQAETLEAFYREARSLFGREVKRRILLGTFVLSAGHQDAYYRKACQVRRLICRDFEEAFGSVDVIAGPVAPGTAFSLGAHSRSPLQMYLNDLFAIPANLAGLPAISIPAGRDSGGLPVGLQLIGRAFDEDTLLSTARTLEEQS